MILPSFIAWFYWNPQREAFFVPFIDRYIYWYGILFVLGFLMGYLVIIPPFTRFLNYYNQFSLIDIINWKTFIKMTRCSDQPLIQNFRHFLVHAQIDLEQLPENDLSKQLVINKLNDFLRERSIPRNQFQALYEKSVATSKQTAFYLTERLCWFAIAGTIIGARLGEVFFYSWPYYVNHPLDIFKVWQGGLASHGGVLGVMLALYFYLIYVRRWIPQLTFIRLLDFVAIPSALVAVFIRLGNFINQEIIGTPTTMPWGVVFGHPEDRSSPIARHPVQLYEAFAYLLTFAILWTVWKKQSEKESPGKIIGLMFILIFVSRFFLEFWKSFQYSSLDQSQTIQMGQWLSIPFMILGIVLWMRSKKRV